MERFIYVCVGSAAGIPAWFAMLLMALTKQFGITHRQPVTGYLVLAIFAGGFGHRLECRLAPSF